MNEIPENLKPGQFWHVIYECRDTIVEIDAKGTGFFAFGQDAIWDLSAVAEWVKLIEIDVNASKIQRDRNDDLDLAILRAEKFEEEDEWEFWLSSDDDRAMNYLKTKDD